MLLNLFVCCVPIGICLLLPTGDNNFIKSLVNFDKDNISDRVLKKIGQYCAMPDFLPETVGRVSGAAQSLCLWVTDWHCYQLLLHYQAIGCRLQCVCFLYYYMMLIQPWWQLAAGNTNYTDKINFINEYTTEKMLGIYV